MAGDSTPSSPETPLTSHHITSHHITSHRIEKPQPASTETGKQKLEKIEQKNTRLLHIATDSPRPRIQDNPEMITVDMNTYGITKGDSAHPFLKTCDVASCVAVFLYEPTKQLAGLFHLTTPVDLSITHTWQGVEKDLVWVVEQSGRMD
jgi:hypothetical protein